MTVNYERQLIEKRLREIAKERAECVAICEETSQPLFDAMRAFNESRDIEEKFMLAKTIEREHRRASTWVARSGKAWERRAQLDEEEQELSTRLCTLRVMEQRRA